MLVAATVVGFGSGGCKKNDSSTATETGADTTTPTGDTTGPSGDTASPTGDTGGGGGACVEDPACKGVPTHSVCKDSTTAQICASPAGQGMVVLEDPCPPYQECVEGPNGGACVMAQDKCQPQTSRCSATPDKLEECDDNATYQLKDCAGCVETPIGAACPGGVTVVERPGRITNEIRNVDDPNAPTAWSEPVEVPTPYVLVVATRRTTASPDGAVVIDAAFTDDDGNFTLKLPETLTEDDFVTVHALHTTGGGTTIDFALADPFPGKADAPAEWNTSKDPPDPKASFWFWAMPAELVQGPDPLDFKITEAMGGGLLKAYVTITKARERLRALMPKAPPPLVAWAHLGQAVGCGACATNDGTRVQGISFYGQFYLSAEPVNQGFYADPVTLHELGHWVMQTYGAAVPEGGPHSFNCPSMPGLAWSEGWASLFGQLVLGSPVYYDKIGGKFVWRDLSQRTQGGLLAGTEWHRPVAAEGLQQGIDESEVPAILWGLAVHPDDSAQTLEENMAFLDALASPRMTEAPFAGGYTAKTWSPESTCGPKDVVDTCQTTTHLADFLDALLCSGAVTEEQVNAATVPDTYYPYDPSKRVCK